MNENEGLLFVKRIDVVVDAMSVLGMNWIGLENKDSQRIHIRTISTTLSGIRPFSNHSREDNRKYIFITFL